MSETTETTNTGHEDEAMLHKFVEVFDKARNAIIDASRLAKEVDGLRQEVAGLTGQVQQIREQNQFLDEQLALIRKHRDELQEQVAQEQGEHYKTRQERDSAQRNAAHWQEQHNIMEEKYRNVCKERDDAQFMVMALEDENKKLKDKLDSILKVLHPEGTAPVHAEPQNVPQSETPKPAEEPRPWWAGGATG